MNTTTIENIMLAASAVEIEAGAQKQPAISILGYGGGIMRVGTWGDLCIDLTGLEAGGQIPILADHDPRLSGIVGHGTAQVRDGKLYVAGAITDTTDAAKQVVDLARSGFAFGASVGVEPAEQIRVAPGEKVNVNGRSLTAPRNGMVLIQKGRLREVSVTALACDTSTSVAIAAARRNAVDVTTNTEVQEQVEAERKRFTDITRICGSKHVDIQAKAVSEGWDATRTELEVLRASRPKPPMAWVPSTFTANSTIIEAALLTRMGLSALAEKSLGAEVMELAEHLRGSHLLDLCKAALISEQVDVPRNRMELVRAALSTLSLPVALGDAANKILLSAYTESPATWQAFCGTQNVSDFKVAKTIRPTFIGELEEVPAGGELKHGTIKEAVGEIQARTFGKMLSLDRKDVVNDDLSLFDTTAAALGRSAMRSLSDLVYQTLLANTGSFFAAGHGNYMVGVDTVLSVDGLSRAIALMLAQKDSENRNLDIRPATLLVPPELQQTAKMLLESEFIERATNTPTGNPIKNAVRIETEPRLSNTARFTGASDKAWYLFGTPADAALIVAYLNGVTAPTVEFFGMEATVNRLCVSWRVYFDYGCAFGDYRAAVMSKGQA